MAHTHRTAPFRPERRRRRIEAAARQRRLARRDAYREARLLAAPQSPWLMGGEHPGPGGWLRRGGADAAMLWRLD